MICLKCGKETQEKQVFCDGCLAGMETYPVKPDTAIHLPKRVEEPVPKKTLHRKKTVPYEEQVEHLKTKNRRLRLICIALFLSLGICAAALIQRILVEPEAPTPVTATTGQNYTYASGQ